jgi:hypothetical protein
MDIKNLETLTDDNASNASTVINVKSPESGSVRFNYNEQLLGDGNHAHTVGEGSDSRVLLLSEMKDWKIASYKKVFQVIAPLQTDRFKGQLLNICGQEYQAWSYDPYIHTALEIAEKWNPEDVTHDRIVYLQYWIRENYQHGHNLELNDIRSLQDAKSKIDEIIELEYLEYLDSDDQEQLESKMRDLKQNERILSHAI